MSMNNNEINVNENNTEATESIFSKVTDKVTQSVQNHKVKKAIKTGKISSGKDGLDAALSKATSTSRVLQSKRNKFIDHINDRLSNVNNLENRLEDIKNADGHKDKNFGKICDKIQGKISKLASICKNTINATKRLDQDDTTIEALTMKVTVFNSQFNKLYDEIDTMLDNLAANLKKNGKVKNDTLAKRNATPDLKENASATKEYRDAVRGVKSAKNEAVVADIKEDTTAKAKKIQAKVDGKDAILAAEKGSFAGTVEEIKDLKEEIADLKKESSEKISELEEKVDNAKSDDERTRLQKRLDSLTSRYDKEVKESMDKLAAEEKRLKELREKKAKAASESFTELTDDIALEEVDAVAMIKKWTDDLKKLNEDEKKFYDALDDQRNKINSSYNLQIKVLKHAIEEMKETDNEKYITTLENKRKLFKSERQDLLLEIEEAREIGKDKFSKEDMEKLNAKISRFINYLRSVEKFRHMAVTKADVNPNDISLESVLDSKSGSKAIETLIACYDKDDVGPEELSRDIRKLRNDVNDNIDHDETDITDWLRKKIDEATKAKLEKKKQIIIDEKDKINNEFDNAIAADKAGKFDVSFKNAFIGKIKALCSVLSGIESKVREVARSFRDVKLGFESAVETLFEDFEDLDAFESSLVETNVSYDEAFEAQLKVLEGVKNLFTKKKVVIKNEEKEIKELKVTDQSSENTEKDDTPIDRYFEDAVNNIHTAISAVRNKLVTGERWSKAIKDEDRQKEITNKYTQIDKEIADIETELKNYNFNETGKNKTTKKSELLNLASRAFAVVDKAEKWFISICECMTSSKPEAAVASYCLACIDSDVITIESLLENPDHMTSILLAEIMDLKNDDYIDLAVEGFVSNVKNLLSKISKNKKDLEEEKMKIAELNEAEEKKKLKDLNDKISRYERIFYRLSIQLSEYLEPSADTNSRFDEMALSTSAINDKNVEQYKKLIDDYKKHKEKYSKYFKIKSEISKAELEEIANDIIAFYNRYEAILEKLAKMNYSLEDDIKYAKQTVVASFCKACLESYGIDTTDLDMLECGEVMYEIIAHEGKELTDEILFTEAIEAAIAIEGVVGEAADLINRVAENVKSKIKHLQANATNINVTKLQDSTKVKDYEDALDKAIRIFEDYNKTMNTYFKTFREFVNKDLLTKSDYNSILDSVADFGYAQFSSGRTAQGYGILELKELRKNVTPENFDKICSKVMWVQYELKSVAKYIDDVTDQLSEKIKKAERKKFNEENGKIAVASMCKEIIDRDIALESYDGFTVDDYNHQYNEGLSVDQIMNDIVLMHSVITTESFLLIDFRDTLQEVLESFTNDNTTIDPYEAAIEGFVDTMKAIATDLGTKSANFVKTKATEIKNDPIGFFLNILRSFISWIEALLDKVKGQAVSKNVSTMVVKLCNTFLKDIEGFANGNNITKDSIKKFEDIVDRIHKEYDEISDRIRKDKEAGIVLTDEEVLSVGEAAKYHKCIRGFISKLKAIEKKLGDVNYVGTLYQDKLSPEGVEKYFSKYVENLQAALLMMTSLMRSAYISNKDRVFVGVPTFTKIDRSQLVDA